jgi:ubiquinone/menaquinone biosynthesis C-methylase UbiE
MNPASPLRRFVEQYPELKSALKAIAAPFRPGRTQHYSRVAAADITAVSQRLRHAWQANDIPQRQRRGVEQQLASYRAGQANVGFDTLVNMLQPLIDARGASTRPLSLLEVGCSSGYHSEALTIKRLPIMYSGCDYSPHLIELARRCYPPLDFQVQDATCLQYHDNSFDIVLSGCCLLHIEDFASAIRETARVTGTYAIFHNTPTLHRNPTTYYTKRAYGVNMLEIHFNEQQLISLFHDHGLVVAGITTLHVEWQKADALAWKSYLCKKVNG